MISDFEISRWFPQYNNVNNGYFANGELSTLQSLNWFLLNVLMGNHLGAFALFANALIHPSVIRQLHHHSNWTEIFIKLECPHNFNSPINSVFSLFLIVQHQDKYHQGDELRMNTCLQTSRLGDWCIEMCSLSGFC